MAERARIARYFAPLAAGEPGSFNLSDDAAVLALPTNKQLVVTTDSVIAGIHIMADATPEQFAQKLVRRNLSDLAAMGATPWRYSLNLHTLVGTDDAWIGAFALALQEEQHHFAMQLIGGDSTSGPGPLHATLTCLGLLEGAPLRRNGACAGDDIYVSGTLGDAALALHLLQQQQPLDAALATRYFAPEPRLRLGHMLQGIATATVDISDGLMADLAQLCSASGVAASVQLNDLPRSALVQQHLQRDASFETLLATGGDDYELCFTVPSHAGVTLMSYAQQSGVAVTRIGKISAGSGVTLLDQQRRAMLLTRTGYEHA